MAGRRRPLSCSDSQHCLEVKITNTGKVAGAEVPQLYLNFPASAAQPSIVLKGFTKTGLIQPGQSTTVTFKLSTEDLSMWSVEQSQFVLVKGSFTVSVGASSRDVRVNTTMVVF